MIDYYEAKKLIPDALAEFAHHECPYCQAYIGLDRYISDEEIDIWVRARKDVVVAKAEVVDD